MKHLANHAGDMVATWIIALPIVIICLFSAGWLLSNGILGIEHALDALQAAVQG